MSAWRDDGPTRSVLDLPLPPGTVRLVLHGRGWAQDPHPRLEVDGIALDLRWIDNCAVAVHPLTGLINSAVRISATSVPAVLDVRSSRMNGPPSPSDAILPSCLLPKERVRSNDPSQRSARTAAYLASGQIDLAMTEVAESFLAGEGAEAQAAAIPLIAYFARHPLHRPDAIGALLATFCMDRTQS